ncbi:hypothetical protein BgiMline_004211 [Biomphalaria glabrata]|nr:hypothetical protein BgiMline_030451 [Biomphalaria glabrata]
MSALATKRHSPSLNLVNRLSSLAQWSSFENSGSPCFDQLQSPAGCKMTLSGSVIYTPSSDKTLTKRLKGQCAVDANKTDIVASPKDSSQLSNHSKY